MKSLVRAIILAIAVAATGMPAAAAAPAAMCVSRAEAEGLLLAGLPELLKSLSARCAAELPAGALLGKGGDALATPYREAAREAWPAARATLARVLRAQGIPAEALTDESARAFLQLGTAMIAGDRLKGARCTMVNETLELLRPLPPASMARLLSLIALAGQDAVPAARAARLRICPAR